MMVCLDFYTGLKLKFHWLDEVRRLRKGGVGAMGLRGGVAPFDLAEPEGVDVLLPAAPADGRSRIDE